MSEHGKNNRRVSTRVHTRELDRCVARHMMDRAGLHQVAKGKHSYFSENWRRYAGLESFKPKTNTTE